MSFIAADWHRLIKNALICLLILILAAQSIWAAGEGKVRRKTSSDQIIIKMKPSKRSELTALNRSTGAKIKRNLKATGYTSLKLPPGVDIDKAIKFYKKHPGVEYVKPSLIFHTLAEPTGVVPNDPYFREGYDILYDLMPEYLTTPPQWGLFNDGINMMYVLLSPSPLNGIAGVDINACKAWEITTGSPDVVIAVLDTGIDFLHPDFVKTNGTSKIWRNPNETLNGQDSDGNGYVDDIHGWNFAYNNNDPTDDFSSNPNYGAMRHGTWVAGIAGAATNNGIGIAGVAWECPIMPLKVVDSEDNATEDDIAAAIEYAVDNGAKIINMSLGLDEFSQVVSDAVNDAWARGAICVCAMGNSGDNTLYWPAALENSLSVGAINTYGIRCTASDWSGLGGSGSSGSTYNQYIDVCAPGNEILSFSSIWDEHTYMSYPGTSGAAPFVSGIAALIWSLHPTWTNQQVADQIKYTAIDITSDPAAGGQVLTGWDQYTGWGRVDAYRALTMNVGFIDSIKAVKQETGNTTVRLTNKVLTTNSGSLTNRLYIQEPDRSSGVLVSFNGNVPPGLKAGDVIDVQGSVGKVKGEVAIVGPTVTLSDPISSVTLEPLAMNNRFLGGGSFHQQAGVIDHFPIERTFATGLNNIGLLVKVWGKVQSSVGADWFYIDDGSGLVDHLDNNGVYVYCGSLARPASGSYVSVTGISSCESLDPPNSHILRRVLRPRVQSDIVTLKPKPK